MRDFHRYRKSLLRWVKLSRVSESVWKSPTEGRRWNFWNFQGVGECFRSGVKITYVTPFSRASSVCPEWKFLLPPKILKSELWPRLCHEKKGNWGFLVHKKGIHSRALKGRVCGEAASGHVKIDSLGSGYTCDFLCVCVCRPSGLSAPGCSDGGSGLPPVFAWSDGWSGPLAAARQTHSGQISLRPPRCAKIKHTNTLWIHKHTHTRCTGKISGTFNERNRNMMCSCTAGFLVVLVANPQSEGRWFDPACFDEVLLSKKSTSNQLPDYSPVSTVGKNASQSRHKALKLRPEDKVHLILWHFRFVNFVLFLWALIESRRLS